MPDIVINTGPIIAMVAATGNLQWLPSLYTRILIPYEVVQEIEVLMRDLGIWISAELRDEALRRANEW